LKENIGREQKKIDLTLLSLHFSGERKQSPLLFAGFSTTHSADIQFFNLRSADSLFFAPKSGAVDVKTKIFD
jgi:hypothetical protein